jgi:hypothetical protein
MHPPDIAKLRRPLSIRVALWAGWAWLVQACIISWIIRPIYKDFTQPILVCVGLLAILLSLVFYRKYCGLTTLVVLLTILLFCIVQGMALICLLAIRFATRDFPPGYFFFLVIPLATVMLIGPLLTMLIALNKKTSWDWVKVSTSTPPR